MINMNHQFATRNTVRRSLDATRNDLRLGIVGTGLMGRGIAQIAAQGGVNVLLHDARPEAALEARTAIAQTLAKLVLLDLTGLDVSHPAMESIYNQYYQEPRFRPSPITRQRLAAGLGDALGAQTVLDILDALHAFYRDPRYRPSPWLTRRARLGVSLLTHEN